MLTDRLNAAPKLSKKGMYVALATSLVPAQMGAEKSKGDSPLRILQAADLLFAEKGFDAVSVRDIALHAGVNKALVFYYFGSKAELFEEVVERYYQAHAKALSEGLLSDGPLADRLHRLMDAYLDFIEENQRYAQLVQRELASRSPGFGQIQKGLTLIHNWFEKNLASVCPKDGPLSSRQLFVSISGLVNTYYLFAPVLKEIWGEDPTSLAKRRERREHLHWVLDAIVDRLLSEEDSNQTPKGFSREKN